MPNGEFCTRFLSVFRRILGNYKLEAVHDQITWDCAPKNHLRFGIGLAPYWDLFFLSRLARLFPPLQENDADNVDEDECRNPQLADNLVAGLPEGELTHGEIFIPHTLHKVSVVGIALTGKDTGVVGGQVQSVPATHRQQVQCISALRGADALDVRVTGEMTYDHLAIGQGQIVVPLVLHYICGLVVDHF